MSEWTESFYGLRAGSFRALEWPGGTARAIFLHGLSGVAEVWGATIAALGDTRPRCIAIDQRGHGQSVQPEHGYRVGDYLGDVCQLIGQVGAPVRLVGHSMGARVAMAAAAHYPELLESVVIADIGPEAWKANIDETVAAFERMPGSFADRDAALKYGSGRSGDRHEAERSFTPRLRRAPDGSYTWLASRQALIETVRVQRARGYWADWDAIGIPAMLVRGGASNELRPAIAEKMRARNPRVRYREIADVGHNIPRLAPAALANELLGFWAESEQRGR